MLLYSLICGPQAKYAELFLNIFVYAKQMILLCSTGCEKRAFLTTVLQRITVKKYVIRIIYNQCKMCRKF